MINFYYYDTATGRVLATGSYNEIGDGAAARALASGIIDPVREYAPGGVRTARPTFNLATLLLDKSTILANGVDSATFTGVPAGTVAKVFKDQDTLPRGVTTVNDGTLVLRVDTAGVYHVLFMNFPTQDATFKVTAT